MRARFPGRRITGDAEKSQQCRKYFLQHSTFAPERPRFEHGGPNLFVVPGAIKLRYNPGFNLTRKASYEQNTNKEINEPVENTASVIGN